ncbi:MAG: D-TA family PLP-dependent enzyme, partial [Bacteroidota bacterium]
VDDTVKLISPSLLVYPDRIKQNIRTMINMAGDPLRLHPHIKTHKCEAIIKLQQKHGINKFKCATIAEAELLAQAEAEEILYAMQPVGANIKRFFQLIQRFPSTQFATIVDNRHTLDELATHAKSINQRVSLYLDLNTGMNRTGCTPDATAIRLYQQMEFAESIHAAGLHVYDGHIRDHDIDKRRERCDESFGKVTYLKKSLQQIGITVQSIIAGGSPSFPIHCLRTGINVSPGTTLLWDARYEELFPDMRFVHAAVLFTRVVSKPSANILCLDIGHKSIASEMNFPRLKIFELEGSEQIGQSEEHLVVRTSRAQDIPIGTGFYAIPYHICPTVAKYEELQVVEGGAINQTWKVGARNQRITI